MHVAPQIFSSTFHFHPLSSSFTLFHPLSYLGLFHIMIWNRQCFQTHKPTLWDGMEISEREFAKSTVMLIILVPLCGANNCISALVLIGCSLREGSLETHQDHLFHIVLHFHRHNHYYSTWRFERSVVIGNRPRQTPWWPTLYESGWKWTKADESR